MKIDFEFETAYGKFCDALYISDDVTYSEEEIAHMKQTRLDNWIAVVTAPTAPELVELDGVQYEKITLDGQVVLKPVGI